MNRVKICGITNSDDARRACSLGAWALGFVFYKKSPRSIGAYKAAKIIKALPPFVTPVGVFVNQKEGAVKDIAEFCGITTLQFHGDETPEYLGRFKKYKIIKAFRVQPGFDVRAIKGFPADAFLFDAHSDAAYGGTGQGFDWSVIQAVKDFQKPYIVSGGLSPKNVRAAMEQLAPYAVDVSSGVEEAPGKKSEQLLKDFFTQVYS